jgi:Leu/Phe-tRNA-protein transferase
VLRHYVRIGKSLSQEKRKPDRDSNWILSEYKSAALRLHRTLRYSVDLWVTGYLEGDFLSVYFTTLRQLVRFIVVSDKK